MKKSNYTKASIRKLRACRIISLLLNLVPMLVFIGIGFYLGEPAQKFGLGMTILTAVALGIIGLVRKYFLKSSLWVVVLGLYWCVDHFLPILLTFAICSLVDEIIMTPLINYYKTQKIANIAIDKRC